MGTSLDYIEYVCGQLEDVGMVRYHKMFGQYAVYINEKVLIFVCNNIVYLRKAECIEELMSSSELGYPYPGAKLWYILDIDNKRFSQKAVYILEQNTELKVK